MVYDDETIQYLISTQNNYALVYKGDGAVIGSIGLNEDADKNADICNVGIKMLETYQNKGLMSEALECVIQNAKEVTKELSYLCMADDKRSQHIAEKFGFKYVKTFHGIQRTSFEEPKDLYYYRLKL